MRFIAIYIATVCIGCMCFSIQNADAAQQDKQAQSNSHSHNGRVHSHELPATGIKHYHKHMHNGRAHIHPYSTKVGFNHSHNLSSRAKAWANAVKHQHGGRTHSHPLPLLGLKHQHPHKHGARAHKHPLPASGNNHYHRVDIKNSSDNLSYIEKHSSKLNSKLNSIPSEILSNKLSDTPKNKLKKKSINENTQPTKLSVINKDLNIQQQISAVLDTPLRVIPKTKIRRGSPSPEKKPIKRMPLLIDQQTINKVLDRKKQTNHKHDGRAHQHILPITGTKHAHKHAHAGRIHSHLIPISNTPHTHNSASPELTISNNKINQIPLFQKHTNKVTPIFKKVIKTIDKTKNKIRNKVYKKPALKVTSRKKTTVRTITTRKPVKQSHQKITAGNRQFKLALRYENGTGVKKNITQAVNWYLRAAKQGNSQAQFNLASLYMSGEGVTQNIPQAIHWYKTAAQNGDVNAQLNLGNQYVRGTHVPKNIIEAAKWYKRAADQGNMRARANLNYLIEDYNGVIKR